MSTTISPSLLPGEAFQASVKKEGTQTGASILSELRKQSSALRETKASRIPRAQDQIKGSCMEGEDCSERERERESERALSGDLHRVPWVSPAEF